MCTVTVIFFRRHCIQNGSSNTFQDQRLVKFIPILITFVKSDNNNIFDGLKTINLTYCLINVNLIVLKDKEDTIISLKFKDKSSYKISYLFT